MKMKRFFIVLLVVIFTGAGCLVGFAAKEKAGEEGLVFGYLSPDQANPFWQRVDSGIREEAKKNGVKVVTLDGAHDPVKQTAQAEDLIRQKVDIILMSPYESDTGDAITELAIEAGIPIFVLDVGGSADYNALVISDNKGGGRLAGEYMLKLVGKNANIFEMQGMLGRKLPAARGDGFNEVMDENGVDIVVRQPADFLRSKGMTVMENVLMTNPDLDGVFCWNDEMAMGAIEAIAAAGKSNQITVIGFDGNQDAVQAVKDGRLAATIAQQPEEFGRMGVQLGLKELNGEPYDKYIPVDCILINKDNADQFLK
jgi:ribose transport system substrate-binding protein